MALHTPTVNEVDDTVDDGAVLRWLAADPTHVDWWVIPVDPAAGTAGLRTLGSTATTAAAGNDARLTDARVPADGSVTAAKLAADVVAKAYVDAATGANAANIASLSGTVSGHTTALAGKQDTAGKGVANGYAGLDGGGAVPLSQLPASVGGGGSNTPSDNTVTAAKLTADSVTTIKIVDGAVTAAKLATDSVTTIKMVADSVTMPKLATAVRTHAAVIGGKKGALAVETALTTKTLRWYNRTGFTLTVTDIYASVDTAPVGAAVTVAVRKNAAVANDATVSIAAAANTGTATGLALSVPDGSYLQTWTTTIGSTTAGTDLTVTAKGVLA